MKEQVEKEELIDLMDMFLNEKGLWDDFKEWIETQGYTMDELGFKNSRI